MCTLATPQGCPSVPDAYPRQAVRSAGTSSSGRVAAARDPWCQVDSPGPVPPSSDIPALIPKSCMGYAHAAHCFPHATWSFSQHITTRHAHASGMITVTHFGLMAYYVYGTWYTMLVVGPREAWKMTRIPRQGALYLQCDNLNQESLDGLLCIG